MDLDDVQAVFRLEAAQLGREMATVTEQEWHQATACPPWRVRDLLAHVRVVIAWLPAMLAAEAPVRAEVSARDYYRPDERFAPEVNSARIVLAQDHARSHPGEGQLVADFTATWQQVDRLVRLEPDRRVVRTRHGDAMLLSEFLLTRVVEIAVHGLDLALALNREPWLTAPAADLVEGLLLGERSESRADLGWDQRAFLLKATGRVPIAAVEAEQIDRLGIRWLALS